jgi:hypothetical protein
MKAVLVTELIASERDLHNKPELHDWPHKVDNIPVRKEVKDFCTELNRSFKGFRFHAGWNSPLDNHKVHIQFTDGVDKTCYSDVTVYIEGSDYVVGRIGFGKRYGVKESEKPSYMIHSRKIKNDKFADHREQYNMMFTADLKKAVRIALSKLTPYSPREMAEVSYNQFASNIESERSKVYRRVADIVDPLRDGDVLKLELENLINQNASFITEAFRNAAEDYLQRKREWEQVRNRHVGGYYVSVRMMGDEQWVDIVDVANVVQYKSIADAPTQSLPITDVPDDIQGKLAVLLMADINQYMAGVGRRATEKSFWVERSNG